ncbi:hypothetical protein C2869_07605 [Saccharobesus litoralis]|uniref:OmpR/PhoB-type domain-containing protein n=2 Tax=Saccharobesus litoralis TaxID=2172099 RepID=A0A2S0VQ18_9ALTE|nr:hypothetical protein C2869_07605 [Saccharobesus litoralis]
MVDPNSDQISFAGQTNKVEPKVMAVLLYLIDNRCRVVSVEEILSAVWSGVVVTPQTAQRCISVLRKLFSQADDGRDYIKTYVKKGYQIGVAPDLEQEKIAARSRSTAYWILPLLLVIVLLTVFWNKKQTSYEQVIFPHESQVATYALHPNKAIVAYIKRDPFSTNGAIWLGDTNNPREIAKIGHILPTAQIDWSPDGQSLLVMVNKKITIFKLNDRLDTIVDKSIVLSEADYRYRQADYLDENHALITRLPRSHGVYDLYKLNLQTKQLSRVLADSGVSAFALNKQLIAYVHRNGEIWHVKVFDLTLHKEIANQVFKQVIRDIEWLSDDMGLIAHVAQNELYIIPLAGKPQRIANYPEAYVEEIELGQRQQLYYLKKSSIKKLYLGQANVCCSSVLPTENIAQYHAVWDPLGKSFAYVTTTQGTSQVWLYSGGIHRQLTQFTQQQKLANLNWSSDGHWLLFKVNDDIYAYSLLLSTGNTLLSDVYFSKPLGFNKNKEFFYYLDTNGYQDRVWKVSLADTSKQKVLTLADDTQVVSSNGNIFYLGKGKNQLYMFDGQTNHLLDSEFPDDATLHSANAQAVFYFLNRPGSMKNIWQWDLTTREQKIVVPRLSYSGDVLSISPQQKVVYGQDIETKRKLYKRQLAPLLAPFNR